MSVHVLKIKPQWLDRVLAGEKRAEIRKHDRDFQVGDTLHLMRLDQWGRVQREWVERDERGRFVNKFVDVEPVVAFITHVLDGRMVDGLADDYCLLSIEVEE